MKLFGRMTFMSLAVLLVGSLGFLSPMMVGGTARGESYTLAAPVITLTDYTPTYKINTNTTDLGSDVEGYKLPTATSEGAELNVTATMSSGKNATVQEKDGAYYLVTDKAGKYFITYTATKDDKATSTQNVVVEITSDGATLEFDSNSKQIIPTIAYKGDIIVFPKAKVMIDGEEDTTKADSVTLTLKTAKGNTKELNTKDGYQTYTVVEKDNEEGDFYATYSYTDGGKSVSKTVTFKVNSNKPEIALSYSNNVSSQLENLSLAVGVEATLPTPVVVNTKASNVDVSSKTYTEIAITGPAKADGSTTETITDYKFTPWAVGNYRIKYVTTDFFGNKYDSVDIQRDNIKLSAESITVKPYSDYTVDSTKSEETNYIDYSKLDMSEIVSHEYDVKSVYYAGDKDTVTCEFPAILAKGGWGDYSNLLLTRTVYKSNGSSSSGTVLEESHTVGGTSQKYEANEVGKVELAVGESYEIIYKAQYKETGSTTAISGTEKSIVYKFEVKAGSAPTTAEETNLKITAPSIPTLSVLKNAGKTITFNAPSVSDDSDARLKVDVTYAFSTSTGDAVGSSMNATKNSDGTYAIDVKQGSSEAETWATATKMTITFNVTNDQNVSATTTKVIELLDYTSDKTAPTIEAADEAGAYNANDKTIKMPAVQVKDTDSSVSLVMYVIKDKKVIDTFNGNSVNASGNNTATMTEFDYEPATEGDYTFVYVATDQNLNSQTFSTSCTVSFKLGYSVSIASISTQEYGTVLDLPSLISITKNGEVINIENANIAIASDVTSEMVTEMSNNSMLIQVTGAYTTEPGTNGSIKCSEGKITVKAWVKDDEGVCKYDNNCSSLVSFESKDTIAPEFTIENESSGSDIIGSYEFSTDSDADKAKEANTHVLPWFDVITENGHGIDVSSRKIELTYTSATKPFATFTVDDAKKAKGLEYTVTKQGKIKAVYSVSDNSNNTSTRTFYINIGDVVAPEIVIANDAITAPTKVGEDCVISFAGITFENDESLSKTSDLNIVVKLNGTEIETEKVYDEESSSSTQTGIKFKASEAGDYVITFDVKDSAGNEATTVTKTVTVKADSVNRTNSSTVWGTIMIIISLIVVGVVIYFFVKPSKTKTKANSKKTK